MLNELSLFSGAGGGLIASQYMLGFRTLGYVEWDPYCQRVLRQRIADGLLAPAPIFGDIRSFVGEGYAREYRGMVEVVSGGFPCQPFSLAGGQLGEDDPRNMWPAFRDVVREVGPRFVFLENTPGLRCPRREKGNPTPTQAGYLGRVLGDLADLGYDAEWCVLSAADVGAPHLRKRVWVLAYASVNGRREGGPEPEGEQGGLGAASGGVPLAYPQGLGRDHGLPADDGAIDREGDASRDGGEVLGTWWDSDPADVCGGETKVVDAAGEGRDTEGLAVSGETEGGGALGGVGGPGAGPSQPFVGRMAHGVPDRVDRLRALGNGQVPLAAAEAWRRLRARIG